MSARPTPEPLVFCWSGGKDSAMALHALRADARYEIVELLTTISEEYRRISHHGVREELLDRQAEALDVPLRKVWLAAASTNERYEEAMGIALGKLHDQGVRAVGHGDIFLQDLRDYRERNLAKVGMHGVFPLWKRDTTALIRGFIDAGFRGTLSCVQDTLGVSFAGREIDAAFLRDLPDGVDPCGENGEYHSFVWDGPIFRSAVPIRVGETVHRDTRYFADLLPA